MALVRMTEKKLAANRANAKKSTGPRTPQGKARSSRNGCVHHGSARLHPMPESWDEEFRRQAELIVAPTANPMRRALEFDVAYHILWSFRLLDQEAGVINVCLNRFPPDSKRGAHPLVFDPGVRAFRRHMVRVERKIGRAIRALCAYLKPPIPRGPRVAVDSQLSRQLPGLDNFLAMLMQIRQLKPNPKQNKAPAESGTGLQACHPTLAVAGAPSTKAHIPSSPATSQSAPTKIPPQRESILVVCYPTPPTQPCRQRRIRSVKPYLQQNRRPSARPSVHIRRPRPAPESRRLLQPQLPKPPPI